MEKKYKIKKVGNQDSVRKKKRTKMIKLNDFYMYTSNIIIVYFMSNSQEKKNKKDKKDKKVKKDKKKDKIEKDKQTHGIKERSRSRER